MNMPPNIDNLPNYDYITEQHDNIKYAEIYPMNSINNIITDINEQIIFNESKPLKLLVAFDIDDTLVFNYIENTDINNTQMVIKIRNEDNIVANINNLTTYADVICITARSADNQVDLKQYGFDLTADYNKITLNEEQQQLFENNGYAYYENIIYTSLAEKGIPLKLIYDFSTIKYDKIFFIDDMEINCMFVNNVLTNSSIVVQTYNVITDNNNLSPANKETPLAVPIATEYLKQQAYFHK